MKVREIMTAEPRYAAPDTTLEEIATMMKEEDVGVIPVVEDGEVTGLVTDRDIVVRCIAAGKDPSECTAEDIMSEEVRTVEPDADLDDAADIMAEVQIRRLPVVEDGRLIGMITLGDIAVKATDEEETTSETLEEVSQGVKPSRVGKRGASASENADAEEENELESTGSANRGAGRQAGGNRANWNQGDREVQERGGNDKRKVASAESWEGGRGRGDRQDLEEGRQQQRKGGRGSQQPGVRGRTERSDRRESNRGANMGARGRDSRDQRDRGRVQQTGGTRTSERGRPEKVGHGEQGISMRKAPQGAQGISNRAAGRENARQAKVNPKRAEARGKNNKRRAS